MLPGGDEGAADGQRTSDAGAPDLERSSDAPAGRLLDRFIELEELGRGGTGVVTLVEDRLRGQQLALKRMQHATPEQCRRIKREFRSIERIVHPNVVTVVELGLDGDVPYFLMERVEGQDLRSACRGELAGPTRAPTSETRMLRPPSRAQPELTLTLPLAAPEDGADDASRWDARSSTLEQACLERLYVALPQLLSALEHLHAVGLVHRDLKPANVVVRHDGVLKLLDFGTLDEIGAIRDGRAQGSAAYVSPEHARGEPPRPENDLYSLGVLLFETVTGHLPFVGALAKDVLLQHLHATPPPVQALTPECPGWLAALIAELLAKAPEARPSLAQVRARCARHLGGFHADGLASPPPQLLERDTAQQRLLDLLAESAHTGFRAVALCGASGLGKTALLEWTRQLLQRRQLAVLTSRIRPSERVPFNAVDGLVDDLSGLLEGAATRRDEPRERFLRDKAGSAFAVLRDASTGPPSPGVDPRVAFDALIELMARVAAERGRLWLLCDDLQWADADSVRWLGRMFDAAPQGVTLLASVRDDLHSPAFAPLWARDVDWERLELPRLSEAALSTILVRVASDAGRPLDPLTAAQAAVACDGRPLLAVVTARAAAGGATSTDDEPVRWLLRGHLQAAPLLREALAVLAAAEGERSLGELGRLCGQGWGALDALFGPLVRERLVQPRGRFSQHRVYDFSHDLIRRSVLGLLEPGECQKAHAGLARELERQGAQPALRVRHLLGAGETKAAALLAATGARAAEASNAFGLAGELFAIAIEHGDGPHDALHEARAMALERCGRYLDAAAQWQRVAELREGEARVGALLHKAKAQLATEHVNEGRKTLEAARRERQKRALLSERASHILAGIRFTLGPWAAPGPWRVRGQHHSRPTDDRDIFLGTMLAFFSPFAGVRQVLQVRGDYRRAGNRVQSAEVDYVLGYIALWGSQPRAETRLGERYMASARRVLGGVPGPEAGRPHALDVTLSGVVDLHNARWDAAREKFDRAIEFQEQAGRRGSFEHMFVWTQRLFTDWFRQDMAAMTDTLDIMERLATDVQDPALRCEIGFARTCWTLLRGDADGALRKGREVRRSWPEDGTSNQCYVGELFMLTPLIYTTDGVDGFRRISALRERYAHFMPGHGMYGCNSLSHFAIFELAGLRAGEPGASRKRIDAWAKRAVGAAPMNSHLAVRASAYAAEHAGEPERALRILEEVEARAASTGQQIDVAVTRYQRGLRLGGDTGRELTRDARRVILSAGAHPLLLEDDFSRR